MAEAKKMRFLSSAITATPFTSYHHGDGSTTWRSPTWPKQQEASGRAQCIHGFSYSCDDETDGLTCVFNVQTGFRYRTNNPQRINTHDDYDRCEHGKLYHSIPTCQFPPTQGKEDTVLIAGIDLDDWDEDMGFTLSESHLDSDDGHSLFNEADQYAADMKAYAEFKSGLDQEVEMTCYEGLCIEPSSCVGDECIKLAIRRNLRNEGAEL